MRTCLSPDELLAYLSGDLTESSERELELESHLFGCSSCTAEAERIAGLLASITDATPPILSPSRFLELERQGRVEHVNVMRPGQTAEVDYPEAGRVLVHRLIGLDAGGSSHVDLDVTSLAGESLMRLEAVPVDEERGEILLTCHRHYAGVFPPNLVFRVDTVSQEHREEVARYTVHHRLT